MPQFDYISFLNQLYWLLFFFFNFYFFITFFFLPNLCKILKFRKKKIFTNRSSLNKLNGELLLKKNIQNKTKSTVLFNLNENITKITNQVVINSSICFNFTIINNLVQFYIFKNFLIKKN